MPPKYENLPLSAKKWCCLQPAFLSSNADVCCVDIALLLYAGIRNLSNNLFYTHNTSATTTECVYYTGSIGIVFNKEKYDSGKPCQRFFFGHDNDIGCLALHPSRRFVATGQQISPGGVPYACIWDVDTCNQLQRLDHDRNGRSIIALAFSGNINAANEKAQVRDRVVIAAGYHVSLCFRNYRSRSPKTDLKLGQYIAGTFPMFKLFNVEKLFVIKHTCCIVTHIFRTMIVSS